MRVRSQVRDGDIASTYLGLQFGFTEANRLAAALLANGGEAAMFLFKAVISLMVYAIRFLAPSRTIQPLLRPRLPKSGQCKQEVPRPSKRADNSAVDQSYLCPGDPTVAHLIMWGGVIADARWCMFQ